MTKSELLSTYTAEQLAEMVVELQNGKENNTMNISDIQKCQKEYEKVLKESPLNGTIDKICKDILEQKNNAMAMEFTRIICDLLKRYGVHVHCTETKFSEKITHDSIEERYGIVFNSVDFSEHDKGFMEKIEELKKQLDRSNNTINQIDDILEKLFGVRHDIGKPDEFEKILADRVKSNAADFLPAEPIKVADMLINEFHTADYIGFDISELRQVAEHLLVYCNHNEEAAE